MFSHKSDSRKRSFVSRFIYREETYIGRQQLMSLIYYVLQVAMVSVLFLPKAIATSRFFFVAVIGTLLVIAIMSFGGYLKNIIRLSTSLRIMIYSAHTIVSSQMIYISLNNVALLSGFHKTLLMSSITLMILDVALSIIACLKYDPLVLSALSLLVYIFCAVATGDEWFRILSIVVLVSFLLLGLLGSSLVWSASMIQHENQTLKQEDEALFSLFKLSREQVTAYVRLAEQEMTNDKIVAVFDMLGRKAQRNVLGNLKRFYVSKQFGEQLVKEKFPNLSPAEREVCLLVLHDKKLGDMCSLLGKNESNITTTRSNIRKKLGLKPEDDLREVLLSKVTLE
jgi:hypothetical protein